MTAGPDPGTVWLLVVVLGAGTFVLRLSFIQVYASLGEFPPGLERALGFIPAAILAALITPALFSLDGPLVEAFLNARVVAASVAAVVAWRTRSIMGTIAAGMVVLWGLRLLLG